MHPVRVYAGFLISRIGGSVAIYTPSQNTLTVHMQGVPNSITLTIPQTLTNLFLIPPNYDVLTYLVGITSSFDIVQIHVQHPPEEPKVYIDSISRLPENVKPAAILPVDPMEWAVREKDLLLSVDEDGGLQFWVSDVQLDSNERGRRGQQTTKNLSWRCTGSVNSRRKGLFKARCSSTKKSVLGPSSGLLCYIATKTQISRSHTKWRRGLNMGLKRV